MRDGGTMAGAQVEGAAREVTGVLAAAGEAAAAAGAAIGVIIVGTTDGMARLVVVGVPPAVRRVPTTVGDLAAVPVAVRAAVRTTLPANMLR